MNIIDTHTHLYGKEFDKDRKETVARANEIGISTFYLPAINSESIPAMLQMEIDFPGQCIAMMGLHPCYVKENWREELTIVKDWLGKRKFAAVGEIGLDFYWDKAFETEQYQAFETQMQLALDYNLTINIHTRNAMQETINRVKPFAESGLKGIFHCFGGSYETAKQIIDMDFSLGIGGVLTYKNAGLPEVLKKVPLEYIVLETDAPYLSPVPFRGKRNESSYLKYVVEKLGDVYGISTEAVADATTANAKKIFAL